MMAQRMMFRRWRSVFRAFIANSEATGQRLTEDGVGPVRVMANGTIPRHQRPPLSGPPVMAYAGRLSLEKGVAALLRAFAGLKESAPEVRLWIAGDGPEASSLRRLAADLGMSDRVDFLGALSREALEARFDAVWAQIVPSIWDEPFGMVAIEAMMRGTAVIASDGGGLRDIVRPDTGVLVPPGERGRARSKPCSDSSTTGHSANAWAPTAAASPWPNTRPSRTPTVSRRFIDGSSANPLEGAHEPIVEETSARDPRFRRRRSPPPARMVAGWHPEHGGRCLAPRMLGLHERARVDQRTWDVVDAPERYVARSPRLLLSPAADSRYISAVAGARPARGRRSLLASSGAGCQSRDYRRAGHHGAESPAGPSTVRVGNALSLLSAGRPPAEPARSCASFVRLSDGHPRKAHQHRAG